MKGIATEVDAGGRLRLGVAGLGRSGHDIHVRNIRLLPDRYEIASVADLLPERRDEARQECGARAYRDWRTLLAKGGFDVFVNALPSHLHVQATLDALRAGYHVLSEKPMAATVRELDAMEQAARKARRVLAPFQNNRVQPFFCKIQEILASGVLGEILHIRSVWGHFTRRWDWQTLRRNMGGVLFNTGPHAVDQALALVGFDREPEVSCRMACGHYLGGDAEDLCALTLHGRGMPIVEILLTQYRAHPTAYLYEISGHYGGLTASAEEVIWKYYDPKRAPRQRMWKWSVNRQYPSEDLPWTQKHWAWTADEEAPTSGYTLRSFGSGAQFVYVSLHDAVTRGRKLAITTRQVRPQIAIFEECRRQNPHIWKGYWRASGSKP